MTDQITTVEELEALPNDAVVGVFEKDGTLYGTITKQFGGWFWNGCEDKETVYQVWKHLASAKDEDGIIEAFTALVLYRPDRPTEPTAGEFDQEALRDAFLSVLGDETKADECMAVARSIIVWRGPEHGPTVRWRNDDEPWRDGKTCKCGLKWPHPDRPVRPDVEEQYDMFVRSFNGDEAGDLDDACALDGNYGWVMRGGNDARAVFEKARAVIREPAHPSVVSREQVEGAVNAAWRFVDTLATPDLDEWETIDGAVRAAIAALGLPVEEEK